MFSFDGPKSVKIGTRLLYLGLIIGLVMGVINAFTYTITPSITPLIVIVINAVVFVVGWLIVFMISRRHNWARILYLVLFIIAAVFMVLGASHLFDLGILDAVVGLVNAVITLIGIIFLFKADASAWFKAKDINPSDIGNVQ